jgi:tripartite-type tricarboxylate transporter receptor subunit TctC
VSILLRLALIAGLCVVALAQPAAAQSYPTKVVRLIVPYSAGSGADTVGRIIAEGLTGAFGHQVIVDNRAGASGNIGAELAARAAPDGYTILLVNVAHAANASLFRKLPYDLMRDFAPVTQFASSPAVIVVHPSLPARSVAELVRLARSKPGAINYASGGAGTFTFLAAELFKRRAGVDLMHVPYKSGGEALTSVVSGETSVYFAPLAAALPQVRAGRLRPLAMTSARRVPVMPELPTVRESGYGDYEFGNWYGLMAPARTPKETIAALRGATVGLLGNPAVTKRLSDLGYVAVGNQPEEFSAHINSEIARLGKIIRDLKISTD